MSGESKYRMDENGVLWVRKMVFHRIGMFETSLATREMEFPCKDSDGDGWFLLAFAGGWFGLHKFLEGHYAVGIAYAITCGFGGAFYVCDLIAMATGNYVDDQISIEEDEDGRAVKVRRRFYNRPLQNKKAAYLAIAVSFLIALCAVRFLYIPFLGVFSSAVVGVLRSGRFVELIQDIWM